MNVVVVFLNEKYNVKLSKTFKEFKLSVSNIVQAKGSGNNLSNLKFYYNDPMGNKIEFANEEDYMELINNLYQNKVKVIELQLAESFMSDSKNLLNKEDINENKFKSIKEDPNLEKISVKQSNNNQIPSNKKKFENINQGNVHQNTMQYPQSLLYQQNKQPQLNQHNVYQNQQRQFLSQIQNPNNQNNLEQFYAQSRQPIQNSQLIKVPQLTQQSPLNSQARSKYVFNTYCSICNISPIPNLMYYCPRCNKYSCENCEEMLNKNDNHAIMKIRNLAIFKESIEIANLYRKHLQEKAREQEFFDTLAKIPNKISSVFDEAFGDGKNKKKKAEQEKIILPEAVKKARSQYDLSKFTDLEIQRAICASNGSIDGAVCILVEQNSNNNLNNK